MKIISNTLKFLFIDRTARTSMLAVSLMVIMGSFRPVELHGLYESEYWAKKGDWSQCADMVLAGDSRILEGLSPLEMKRYFPGQRIYNYGFGGAWFSKQYMDKVESLLDPKSGGKMIIMGISPHSLTKRPAETGRFFDIFSLPGRDRFIHIYFGSLMDFFNPLSFKDALSGIFPPPEKIHIERTLYADGWIAVHREPISVKDTVKRYTEFYKQRLVDPCNVENVTSYVKRWTSRGIKVYGFIPPTSREMYELETAVSGLDRQGLVNKFEAAGGVWIDVEPFAYSSFDGSHLQDDGAIQFTKDLCRQMVQMDDEIKGEGTKGK